MAELVVQIRNINDPLLHNVFNLGFGPPDNAGSFSDTVSINQLDPVKIFSTILLLAITFLKCNLLLAIGIDARYGYHPVL